jgi:hypothetical protein
MIRQAEARAERRSPGIFDLQVGYVLAPRLGISIPLHNREPPAGAYDGAALTAEDASLSSDDPIAGFELGRGEHFFQEGATHDTP